MTEEFLVSWKGETLGPFTRDEVESRLRSGEITPLHAIRRNGELIDAARWLHSLRPAKSPTVPALPPEPIAPPPPAGFPVSAPVEELHSAPPAFFANAAPLPAPLLPPPPVPANYEALNDAASRSPENPTGKATAGLVLGIIGFLAWIIPLIGFPVSIVGLVLSSKGMQSSSRGMAIAGLVLNIIGIMLCTINAISGAILGSTGQHPLLQ